MSGRIMFYRTWRIFNGGTSGGQLKVRDAFEHAQQSSYHPVIHFGSETKWYDNPGNVWMKYKDIAEKEWIIGEDDILFFAGKDWLALPENERINPPVPVINIAQPRQITLKDIRKLALKYPAIRISKSKSGKRLLEEYGVNGPVYYIPDGVDLNLIPAVSEKKDIDILIVGLKRPEFALKLSKLVNGYLRITGKKLKVHVQYPPKLPTRMDFLRLLSRSKMVMLLPYNEAMGGEGFYLPAVEAMALKAFVICPDAIGNREFCIHEKTCLTPEYSIVGFFFALRKYLKMSEKRRGLIIQKAQETAFEYNIDIEKERYIELINNAKKIWHEYSFY